MSATGKNSVYSGDGTQSAEPLSAFGDPLAGLVSASVNGHGQHHGPSTEPIPVIQLAPPPAEVDTTLWPQPPEAPAEPEAVVPAPAGTREGEAAPPARKIIGRKGI